MKGRSSSRLVLDVNDWHPIAAQQLAGAGLAALVAKATQGDTFVARTLEQHRAAARACRVPFGSYLYLDVASRGNEAAHYLAAARPQRGDLQPIIDAEDLTQGVELLARRTVACASALAHHGYRPIGYGSASTILAMLAHGPDLRRLPWWEADYPGRFTSWSPGVARLRIRLAHRLTVVMWQWTDELRLGRSSYDASRLFVPVSRLLIP